MISLGIMALGAFVGALVAMFVVDNDSLKKTPQALTGVLAAALGGSPPIFIGAFGNNSFIGPFVAMYPIGLCLGVMSIFLTYAARVFEKGHAAWNKELHLILSCLHVLAVAGVLGAVLYFFAKPEPFLENLEVIDKRLGEFALNSMAPSG